MAKRWQDLHDLIHSLSPAEKGYFKKHWAGFSGEELPKSLAVFDLLAKMKVLKEDKVLALIGGSANTQKSLRNHLHKQILRSLRLYKNDADTGFALRESLDYIEILQKKGLYKQALSLLTKGTAIAADMKMQPYHVLFLIQQKQFLNQYPEKDKTELAVAISKTILSASALIVNRELIKLGHVKSLYWNNVFVPLRDDAIRTESELLLNNLLAIDAQSIEDYSEKNLLFAALSNIYLLHGDIASAIIHQNRSVLLMESMDVRKINRVLSYVSALYNLASLQINIKQFDAVAAQIMKIKNLNLVSTHETHFVNAVICCLEAQLLQSNTALPFNAPALEAITQQLGEDKPIPNLFYDSHFALMCYCVQHNQYQQALDRSQFLYQNRLEHSQQSFHVHVRLMHIIIHFKHNNIQLLPFLIRNTYRFMLKQELNYQIEKSLLRFFRKIPAQVNAIEMRLLLTDLYHEINEIALQPSEARVMEMYFNYAGWLEQEINT